MTSTWETVLTSIGEGEYVPPVCRPDDPYCLLYTSGTTGRPKGVITPHRMVAWNAYNTVACWQLSEDDVSPIFTPLYHAGGLGAFLMPILLAGGTIVLHREFDPSEVWRVDRRGALHGGAGCADNLEDAGRRAGIRDCRARVAFVGSSPAARRCHGTWSMSIENAAS